MDKSKDKALVNLGEALDMRYILPVTVTDGMVMASTYRGEVRGQGRVTIPKNIREALGLAAGDSVDVTIRPANDPVKEGDKK